MGKKKNVQVDRTIETDATIKRKQIKLVLPEAKPKKATTVDITCCDCGKLRVVKTQDAFQVKRCVQCQEAFKKIRRNNKKKVIEGKTQPKEK